MISQIIPKLPFINKKDTVTYFEKLNFSLVSDYGNYLILKSNAQEIHFFEYPELDPANSDFMLYLRVQNIEDFYKNLNAEKVEIHPNGTLEIKPWNQKEFSLLDPNGTLLTFGENV